MFRHIQCMSSINTFSKFYALSHYIVNMLNIFYEIEKGPQMQVKQFLKYSRQGLYEKTAFAEKCWNENYKYILGKFLAIHFDLIFLLDSFKLKIF